MAPTSNHLYVLQAEPCLLSVLSCKRSAEGVDAVDWQMERGEWAVENGTLATALSAFREAHIPTGATLYTVLPRQEIATRVLTLPSHDDAEIASMIRLSAEEYVPFSQQELVVDVSVMAKRRDGTARVLAAFAHRDVVEGHVALLRSAGLEPQRIFLSTACLASAVGACRTAVTGRFAVANLGASGLEVAIFGDEGLEYGRAVTTRQDWSLTTDGGAEALEEFGIEVRASLSAHRRESEDGLGADMVYVTSDWADVTALCETAAHELGIEVMPAPFSEQLARGKGVIPLPLLGGALSAQERGKVVISLVPASLQAKRGRAQAKRKAIQIGGLVAALVLAGSAIFVEAVWQRTSYIAGLRASVDRIAPEAQATLIKQRQLQVLSRQVKSSGTALDLLAKISGVAPSSVNITRFDYRRGQGISIEGRSLSGPDAANFAEAIRRVAVDDYRILAGASMTNTAGVAEQRTTVYQYTIDIPFPKDEDLEDGEGDGQ